MKKFNIINKLQKQQGAVLLLMVVILVVGAAAMLVNSLSATSLQLQRDKVTADALAQAKEALIGYAATAARPGDLPCPDTNNDGATETSCGNGAGTTGQSSRIGRLPWKTLGLPDLRDGSGERLWYAVSYKFKYNFAFSPLNSDTTGTISVRTQNGTLLHDASSTTGAVALVIAPGEPLQRTDQAAIQDRSTGANVAINYLEIASGEDNANFTETSTPTNGFIQGRIKDTNGQLILNDQILVITRETIMQAIQKKVLAEAKNALAVYFCGVSNVNTNGNCISPAGGNRFFPRPASFSDNTCLGNGNLFGCNPGFSNRGRIPANPVPAWAPTTLNGSSANWFQDNAWREVIYYAVAPACTNGTSNCNGAGYLTLNNPPAAATVNQKLILIATGAALGAQTRSGMDKNTLSNYLEDENLSPLDDVYTRSSSTPFNDYVIAIP